MKPITAAGGLSEHASVAWVPRSGPEVVNHNPIADCASLELDVPTQSWSDGRAELVAELIFGTKWLTGDGCSVKLGVKAGTLRLQLDGCKVVPQSRRYMHDLPATETRKVSQEETQKDRQSAAGTASGSLSFGSDKLAVKTDVGGQAAKSRESETVTKTAHEGTIDLRRVTARADRSSPSWDVCEPVRDRLDGRCLGTESLCEIALMGVETFSVSATFTCVQYDLAMTEIICEPTGSWTFGRNINKDKIVKALIAKRLGRDDLLDEIVLCKSTLTGRNAQDGRDTSG